MRDGTTEARLGHSVFAMLCQGQSFALFRLDSRQEHAGMTDSGGKQPGIKPAKIEFQREEKRDRRPAAFDMMGQ
jgi:hypothetical protein